MAQCLDRHLGVIRQWFLVIRQRFLVITAKHPSLVKLVILISIRALDCTKVEKSLTSRIRKSNHFQAGRCRRWNVRKGQDRMCKRGRGSIACRSSASKYNVQVTNASSLSSEAAGGSDGSPAVGQAGNAGKRRQDAAATERLRDLQNAWIKKVSFLAHIPIHQGLLSDGQQPMHQQSMSLLLFDRWS